ncbi:MAG: GAF domain-containing protein, partial [Chloroflexi bacterium]|nr:GAF domain-containing protein [Chloroflexota bacterium]
ERGYFVKKFLAGPVNSGRPVGNERHPYAGQVQYLIDTGRTLIRDDIAENPKFPFDQEHLASGLRSSIAVPIFSQERIIGIMCLRSQRVAAYGRREQSLLERLAERIAPALDNAMLAQRLQAREEELAALEEIARIITSASSIDQVYERFAIGLQRLVEFDWMNINFIDVAGSSLVNKYLFGEGRPDRYAGAVRPLKGTFAEKVLASGKTVINQLSADSDSPVERELLEYGIKTSITLPLVSKGQIIAVLGVRSHLADAYGPREQEILERLANQIAPAVAGAQLAEQQKARQAGVSTGEGGSGQSTSRQADLAHTLRGPLTSIKGYTSSLLRTDVAWSAELEREFLETIDREADRLNQAVSDLLDKSLDRDLPG